MAQSVLVIKRKRMRERNQGFPEWEYPRHKRKRFPEEARESFKHVTGTVWD